MMPTCIRFMMFQATQPCYTPLSLHNNVGADPDIFKGGTGASKEQKMGGMTIISIYYGTHLSKLLILCIHFTLAEGSPCNARNNTYTYICSTGSTSSRTSVLENEPKTLLFIRICAYSYIQKGVYG